MAPRKGAPPFREAVSGAPLTPAAPPQVAAPPRGMERAYKGRLFVAYDDADNESDVQHRWLYVSNAAQAPA